MFSDNDKDNDKDILMMKISIKGNIKITGLLFEYSVNSNMYY